MDKYAVDLDKVLNDFEYSELTNSGAQQLRTVNPSALHKQDFYKLNRKPTKHTINNVFQSLNEYLNTDIEVKSKPNVQVVVHDSSASSEDNEPLIDNESNSKQEEECLVPVLTNLIYNEEEIVSNTVVEEIQNDEPKVEELTDVIKEVTLVPEQTTESVIEEPTELADNTIVVGFDAEIEVDELELNEYLDEVENEFKTEEVPAVEESALECNFPKLEDEINEAESNLDSKNAISRPNVLDLNNPTKIDLIGR